MNSVHIPENISTGLKNIHMHPAEGHWKFHWVEVKYEGWGGGGGGEYYGYFQEQHKNTIIILLPLPPPFSGGRGLIYLIYLKKMLSFQTCEI